MPLTVLQKKVAFGILRHLKSQLDAAALEEDNADSLSVGLQCLTAAYGLRPDDPDHKARYGVEPTLEDLFLKLSVPDAADLAKADALKQKGNSHLKLGKFEEAIDCYSQAVTLDPQNATYFCNRAAAYIKMKEMEKALEDCRKAVVLDPTYARAHGRMGYILSSLNRMEESKVCFKKAIELDPGNDNYRSNLETVEQELKSSNTASGTGPSAGATGTTPSAPSGFAVPPGMDLGSLMSNPNFMSMATQMMQTPAFQNMAAGLMQQRGGGASGGGEGAGSGGGGEGAESGGGGEGAGSGGGGEGAGSEGGQAAPNLGGMMPNLFDMAQQMQQRNPELFESFRDRVQHFAPQNPPPQ